MSKNNDLVASIVMDFNILNAVDILVVDLFNLHLSSKSVQHLWHHVYFYILGGRGIKDIARKKVGTYPRLVW